ncbi:MAG TPA: LytR family transcriptional regulator, partial [Firmicutes bacterium]|nr:LytR family transcriptional regulator [Bacillota bacterium]
TYLRSHNYDVLYIDNADRNDYAETVIYDRVGKIKQAELLGDLLGTDNVFTRKKSESYVDITVILGKDIKRKLKEIR